MKNLRFLLKYIKKYGLLLFLAVLSAVMSGTFAVFAPKVLGETLDIITGEREGSFTRTLLLLIGCYAVSGLFSWLSPVFSGKISAGVIKDMRNGIFDMIQRFPLSFFDRNRHGEVISRITNDCDNISDGLSQSFSGLFGGAVLFAGSLIAMFRINYIIALIVLCITPLSLIVARFIVLRSAHLFSDQQKYVGELNGIAEEYITSLSEVRLGNMQEYGTKLFSDVNEKLRKTGVRAQIGGALINPSTRLVNNISYISVGVAGALMAVSAFTTGRTVMTVGMIASLLTYATQFAKPLNEIAGVTASIQSALASCGRVREIMETMPETDETRLGILPSEDRESGRVSMENVCFSYDENGPALMKNLNIKIEKGQTVAIVGRTGSGKTTLVNLLMRFYDPDSGMIKIGSMDTRLLNRESVRDAFSMVLQDTWIFSGTVRDNIAYARPDASDDEIMTAARLSHAHDFIKRLPEGYDTVISDSGSLSQGQKQLITIARVLLCDSSMLILDEATSSVDILTEATVQESFTRLMKGPDGNSSRTSFIIAHRLATVKNADLILVMDHGDVVEQGTHDELIRKGGLYSELYNC